MSEQSVATAGPSTISRTSPARSLRRWLASARGQSDGREIVAEIQGLLWRSVAPVHTPPARELGQRLPALARLLGERAAAGALTPEESSSILEVYLNRILELRVRELLADALRGTAAPGSRRRRPTFRGFDAFGPIPDA